MIEPGSPAHVYATHANRGCCCLVAAALLQERGLTPFDPTDEGSWIELDPEFWSAVCIWDADAPWSGYYRVEQDNARGSMFRILDGCPPLTDGAWWFVQVWDGSGGQGEGHTYLVQSLPDGSYRVLQSSVSKGYRDTKEAVWARKGRTYATVRLG